MSDNLTDSQRRLLAAMKREMVEVTEPIWKEIEQLRKEQRERHEYDRQILNEVQIENARMKRVLSRIGGLIRALIGGEEK